MQLNQTIYSVDMQGDKQVETLVDITEQKAATIRTFKGYRGNILTCVNVGTRKDKNDSITIPMDLMQTVASIKARATEKTLKEFHAQSIQAALDYIASVKDHELLANPL